MIQLKSVFKLRKYFSDFWNCDISDPESGPTMFSLSSLTQSDHRGARDPVDFSVPSCTMSELSSSLLRLGRLMELQGIASSFRGGATAATETKRRSKGASGGGGGATAAATEAGLSLQVFDNRRVGGESVIRITADDLAEVFDPTAYWFQE